LSAGGSRQNSIANTKKQSHGDVVSLERAKRLVLAPQADNAEYLDVQAAVFAEFDDLSPKERGAAAVGLIKALARMSSSVAR
jgi:hypothetical protein